MGRSQRSWDSLPASASSDPPTHPTPTLASSTPTLGHLQPTNIPLSFLGPPVAPEEGPHMELTALDSQSGHLPLEPGPQPVRFRGHASEVLTFLPDHQPRTDAEPEGKAWHCIHRSPGSAPPNSWKLAFLSKTGLKRHLFHDYSTDEMRQ